jgi:hypothetical protein
LRLGNQQLAADELERLAREHAQLDQPVVLAPLHRRTEYGVRVSGSCDMRSP